MLEGRILSIDSKKITFQVNEEEKVKNNLLNKYVVFNDNNSKKFIGEIYSINGNIVESSLLGYIENNKFIFGDILKPSFNSNISLIGKEELDIMFTLESNSLKIGTSYVYDDYEIGLDINKFFSNHFAILGNTGSGKSYAVASILEKIFSNGDKSPFKSNFFIFDAYGEYRNCFTDIKNKFSDLNYRLITTDLTSNEEKLSIPFYLLDTDDIALLLNVEEQRQLFIIDKALTLVSVFSSNEKITLEYKNDIIARCLLDIVHNNTNYKIRTQVVSVLSKFNTKDINLDTILTRGGWNVTIKQALYVDEQGKIQNIDLICEYLEKFVKINLGYKKTNNYYTILDFYSALEFALLSEGIFNSSRIFDYANILKVRLNDLIKSERKEYFNYSLFVDKNKYICDLLIDKNNNKYQVINYNINSLDDRFAKVIVKIISKWLFDFTTNLNPRGELPIHIILEEAHRYVQNDTDTEVLGYNIFDRIAKEGRKYGILLGIISQRPGELSKVTISQTSNFLVFKMFYKEDLNFVESILPTITNSTIDKLKMFYSGTCLITGTSFKLPLIINVDLPVIAPYSSNVDIIKTWYN